MSSVPCDRHREARKLNATAPPQPPHLNNSVVLQASKKLVPVVVKVSLEPRAVAV